MTEFFSKRCCDTPETMGKPRKATESVAREIEVFTACQWVPRWRAETSWDMATTTMRNHRAACSHWVQ